MGFGGFGTELQKVPSWIISPPKLPIWEGKINGFGLSPALIPAGIAGISRCGNISGIHSHSHFSCSPNPSRGILWDRDLLEPLDLGFVLSRCLDQILLEPLVWDLFSPDAGIRSLPTPWIREPVQMLGPAPRPDVGLRTPRAAEPSGTWWNSQFQP